MNKVYVNAWATNIGRSPRFEDRTCRPTLQCKIAVTLKERAKSASNVIGRARNANTKQTINTQQEVVTGVQLHRLRINDDNAEGKDGTKSEGKFQKSERYNLNKRNDLREVSRTKLMNGRPRTAFARYSVKKYDASKEHFQFVEKSLKVMSISRQISSQQHKLSGETLNGNPEDDNACKDSPSNRILRAKSAPPCAFTSSSGECSRKRQNFHLPLFWRTRKSYHRKQQNWETEVGSFNGDGHKGTQLRALLQNKQTNSYQQSCPYRCKSCFRACLASDTYIQRQLDLKESRLREAHSKSGTDNV